MGHLFNKNLFLFFLILGSSLTSLYPMGQHSEDPQDLIKQSEKIVQEILNSTTQDNNGNKFGQLAILTKSLNDGFTNAEWRNDFSTVQAIRNSITLSFINNLMAIGAHKALINLSTILTPAKKNDAPLSCYTRIQEALSIPSDVYNEIATARTTGCFKELLALKKQQDIVGTYSEEIITQTIVELMGGIYPIPSLADLSLNATACHLSTLKTWNAIKERVSDERLSKELQLQLINCPINLYKDTLLHIFTHKKNENAVKELLAAGADPNLYNLDQEHPLDIAHLTGNNKLIEILKEKTNLPVKNESSQSQSRFFPENSAKVPFYFTMKWDLIGKKIPSVIQLIGQTVSDQSNFPSLPDMLSIQALCPEYVQHWALMSHIIQAFSLLEPKQENLFQEALNYANIPLAKLFILHDISLANINVRGIIRKNTKDLTRIIPILELLRQAGVDLQDKLSNQQDQTTIFHHIFAEPDLKGITLFCKFLEKNGYSYNRFTRYTFGFYNAPLTFLERALLHGNSSIIYYLLTQEKNLELSKDALTAHYGHLGQDASLYSSFLVVFLNLLTNKDLTLEQRLNSIQRLAQWVEKQEHDITDQSYEDYQTFLTLCDFEAITFKFTCTAALNLSLKYKHIPFFNLIYHLALNDKLSFETLFDIDSMRSLFDSIESAFSYHRPSLNSDFIDRFLRFFVQKLSYQKTPFNNLNEECPYSPVHLLLMNTFGWDLKPRIRWIEKFIDSYPELKTKPDFYGNTPLDLIKKDEKLSKNEWLVGLFTPDK